MSNQLYLGELIKRDGVLIQKGKNNLIVAPAGSGKTHYIFNELLDPTKRSIYLCDTSNLMEAVLKDENYFNSTISLKEELNAGKEGFEIDNYNCIVMTYAKFFFEMNKPEYQDIETIVCDEAHNLFKYMDKHKETDNYKKVIEHLEARALKGCTLVSFTATHDRIKRVIAKEEQYILDEKYKLWNVIDYSNNKDIKKLKENFTYKYHSYPNLSYHLKAFNGFRLGEKALIYTDRINTAKDIANNCNKLGLNAIPIWSLNNKDNPMNEEQLKVRKSIIETGLIPDEYNVLIINASYETGINIKDESIQLVIVNSTDEDVQIQSRSRVRHDILALYIKSKSMVDDIKVTIPDEFLNKPLTTKDKTQLIKILNIHNENNRILKWTSIKPIIINSGYSIVDGRITRKKISVSTITKDIK